MVRRLIFKLSILLVRMGRSLGVHTRLVHLLVGDIGQEG
jgi:hypothetical protein